MKRTFVGLLRSLAPTDPVLLLGIMELESEDSEPDPQMLREMFGYSRKNQFRLQRPDEEARFEFFDAIMNLVRKAPSEFPDPDARKKRKLADLPVAPASEEPEGPTKAELKAQKKRDHQTLNLLKLHIQSVMDQIKMKYKKFRLPVIDNSTIAYLYDEQDPEVLTTDLTEEQREQQRLFRPFEVDKDEKGVMGLREVASGKFYYNLESVTIEKRLSNGYYKRPKDFLADIKRLAKDAKMSEDQDRTLKANEMLANVEVDMATLAAQQPALVAECEAVYEREQERERKRVEKEQEALRAGAEVPKITPNVPPANASKTTTETSGPVMLGQQVPGRDLFPTTPARPSPQSIPWSTTQTNGSHPSHQTNGSTVPSRPDEDSEMQDSQISTTDQPRPQATSQPTGQAQFSQRSAHTQLAQGSQPDQYQNSASTTSTGQKSSDRSSGFSGNTQLSNGVRPGEHPDFSLYAPKSGSQLPDTQEPSSASQQSSNPSGSQPSHSSQQMAAPARLGPRASSISALLNDDGDEDEPATRSHRLILDDDRLQDLHRNLTIHSSGLSLEQLEQVHAAIMDVIWTHRGNWNRNHVWAAVQEAFNNTISDIEEMQGIDDPSQKHRSRVPLVG